ncbi:HPF/RaiA family ribosome-associated protein [Phycisphaera mikurensis]|uniref:Ribosomal subunit interface protein n=1 Tax=Phycisphaera mikurensis (strain NBRC 102666 / KCTC 22515 / FYK2301M01) TaxID=1142394 RepID=I0IHV2_PHYMF|nr:HPF/RaiA family ribosome-associated protein [Phycisphaera mikurensis]MBB6441081.1 ribosomal subunit interface protein [Phycisphaera mikurensis]BAM04840.1 hypothetical protein PSMK_26810 [Phycisphaera mikurensis NBRC 102666]
MQIQINFGDVDASDALKTRVNEQVEKAMARVSHGITRVEVHLRDDNAGKHGNDDKRAVMEARPEGHRPITVDSKGEDLYKVIDEAAAKLGRAVKSHLDRISER